MQFRKVLRLQDIYNYNTLQTLYNVPTQHNDESCSDMKKYSMSELSSEYQGEEEEQLLLVRRESPPPPGGTVTNNEILDRYGFGR